MSGSMPTGRRRPACRRSWRRAVTGDRAVRDPASAPGPDAFPNVLGFGPEKLAGETSYQPPEKLFPDGQVIRLTIAGEDIEVAPLRTDATDSVGFWFPKRKLLVTNFTVTPIIFNVSTIRGGRFRDPMVIVKDARWLETKDAELLLDMHNAPVKGRAEVQAAIERSVDQLQQMHDQTIRLVARGLDARQAAEAITMSPSLRDGAELYGQVESHVRAIWNNQRGWFGSDVYDINPLSERDEAVRLVKAMGGPAAARQAAAKAVAAGGIDNWRWGLKLTSLLLVVDPNDKAARKARIVAARAMGQRTTAANARGFYITEALQLEGRMLAMGQPVTVDLLRRVLGTPQKAKLTAAPVGSVLDYLRYLVDPVKAGDKRMAFTLAVEGDAAIHRVQLRNGVLVISMAETAGPVHVAASRAQLADFVLGTAPLPGNARELADFGQVFDRSQFLSRESLARSSTSLATTSKAAGSAVSRTDTPVLSASGLANGRAERPEWRARSSPALGCRGLNPLPAGGGRPGGDQSERRAKVQQRPGTLAAWPRSRGKWR